MYYYVLFPTHLRWDGRQINDKLSVKCKQSSCQSNTPWPRDSQVKPSLKYLTYTSCLVIRIFLKTTKTKLTLLCTKGSKPITCRCGMLSWFTYVIKSFNAWLLASGYFKYLTDRHLSLKPMVYCTAVGGYGVQWHTAYYQPATHMKEDAVMAKRLGFFFVFPFFFLY